ncbi:MAG: hypothetical protein MJ100_07115 [Ruminococcus sp.]|nr:hypothetical protein [Ruminococcus sp.]
MKINVTGGEMTRAEIDKYLEHIGKKFQGRQIESVDLDIDGEFVDIKVYFKDTDFQRAFRSADYLVNDMDKLNNAKQKEFSEKQRHKV